MIKFLAQWATSILIIKVTEKVLGAKRVMISNSADAVVEPENQSKKN